MESSEPIRRTAEIEEITNLYFIHPAASRLVPLLARMGVSPNAVSLAGMLFGVLAGLAYYRYQDPRFAVAGFVLMIAWHVMDGADGQLARLTRSQSRFGQVLDGIADNVTFLAVYASLAIALSRRDGDRIYALVAAAAACHAIQSAAYEVQRQEYECWGWGRHCAEPSTRAPDTLAATTAAPSARGTLASGALASGTHAAWVQRLFGALHRLFYERLAFPSAQVTRRMRAVMRAALEAHPDRAATIRQRYREAFAPLLRQWSVLSANYRTLGIFIAALLKAPEYYFGFEIVGFSAILGLLIYRQSTRCKAFRGALDQVGAP